MSKPKHCEGCGLHHSAKRKKPKPGEAKFNDWCCALGKPAAHAVSHCKLKGLKRERNEGQ